MRIQAAVVTEPGGSFSVEPVELADLRHDEVRVRMVAVGVCHTDAAVRDQVYPTPLPAVLGHEGSGIVEATGSAVTTVEPGDHVVLSLNTCGVCLSCRTGSVTYCEDLYLRNFGGRRSDGSTAITTGSEELSSNFFGQSSFATHANVAERSVVKVRRDVPLELLGPLGCGIQTGAGAIFNSLQPPMGSSLAIFGAGAVGLSALLAALARGCTNVIAIDINDERLKKARSLGATSTINSSTQDVVPTVMQMTDGRGVDYALDATGIPGVLRQAADSLAVRGTVGLVGSGRPGTEACFETGLSITRGWTLRMIIEGDSVPQVFIPQLIDLWAQGRFPFDQLISTYAFPDINTAFADSEQGRAIKPVLMFGDPGDAQ